LLAGQYKRPRNVYSFCIDFKRSINPDSVKLKEKARFGAEVPIFLIPLSKYKARICFFPNKPIPADGEVIYNLSFMDGKWSGKPSGDPKVRKLWKKPKNLVRNYSFEKFKKVLDRYRTWKGDLKPNGWELWDCAYEYWRVPDKKSMARISDKEAYQGTHSLFIKNELPRVINIGGKRQSCIVCGSANTEYYIPMKPNTSYRLSFYQKVVKRVDNRRRFQGIGATLTLFGADKKELGLGNRILAAYSTAFTPEEEFLNKWRKVEVCEKTPPGTKFGQIAISGEISGEVYIDMVELYQVGKCPAPEIFYDEIEKVE
jgi:hypothetical protein